MSNELEIVWDDFPHECKLKWVPVKGHDSLGRWEESHEEEVKCECGGDKARTTHSDWCPKRKV